MLELIHGTICLWYLLLLFGFALLAYWKILKRDIALAV